MSSNTDFTPLAGPYYPHRKRNRAEAAAHGLAVVLASGLYGAWRLLQLGSALVRYLLARRP